MKFFTMLILHSRGQKLNLYMLSIHMFQTYLILRVGASQDQYVRGAVDCV